MTSKTQRIKELLAQGKAVKEIAKQVGCDLSWVYVIRGHKRKYKKRSKGAKKLVEQRNEVARAVASTKAVRAEIAAENTAVNHPSHYTVGGIETYDFIKAKGLSYELGNVVKYITRAKWKADYLEDLKKARWYLDAAIKKEEGK